MASTETPTFVIVFFSIFLGIMILAVVVGIIRSLADKKEEEIQRETRGAEDAAILGRIAKALVVSNPRENTEDTSDNSQMENQTIEIFINDILQEKPVYFSSQELTNITQNYTTKIGSGGYGHVYKGELRNGWLVAVKLLNQNSLEKRLKDQFMAEVGIIGRTNHRNLVRLIGFCFDTDIVALVYEYMEKGSLGKLIGEIEWEKLYEIAVGVAKGIEYLHYTCHHSIIHYDIKPSNILLDSDFCPKLADFGFSKLLKKDGTLVSISGLQGTPGYAAPEVWIPYSATYKCDAYSFGIVLFEILGRERNSEFPLRVWEKFDNGELNKLLLESGIEEKDMQKAETMALVALQCVQYLPEERSSMSSVVQMLEGGAEVEMPRNPFQDRLPSFNKSPQCIRSTGTPD